MTDDGSHNRILEVVRRIPAGRVLTYGDVAALAGLPGHARLVGYALHALPDGTTVPWHRVINARGGISTGRAYPGGELVQRFLLEGEGVEFDARGRTSLGRYRWNENHHTEAQRERKGT
ncbi:MAG TPA: MGMT family protein [Longimicrobium sp.]|jgi:methylated-DNA-protein-cysteine methyltransferase-like protein